MLSNSLKRSVATLGVVAGLTVAIAPAGAVVPAGTSPGQPGHAPTTTTTTTTSQGIIMRDGGVCDPIRHMGC